MIPNLSNTQVLNLDEHGDRNQMLTKSHTANNLLPNNVTPNKGTYLYDRDD